MAIDVPEVMAEAAIVGVLKTGTAVRYLSCLALSTVPQSALLSVMRSHTPDSRKPALPLSLVASGVCVIYQPMACSALLITRSALIVLRLCC